MTLMDAIMKKVKSKDSVTKKYASPPPEVIPEVRPKKTIYTDKFAHVPVKVDDTVPPLYAASMYRELLVSKNRLQDLYAQNMRLVFAIKKAHLLGRVDTRWDKLPPGNNCYYEHRVNFFKRTQAANEEMYKRILSTGPRVVSTASLRRDWSYNRNEIVRKAEGKFVLFPPVITEILEDEAFLAPAGVKRPRAHITLRIKDRAILGELTVELFTDVCPRTCQLFLDLLDGDGLGHSYVGTRFFRKVPGLFWSGGDVIYDNGFGCYAQRDRICPIGVENCHFSHTMPGLLSMRVTKDNEMCGIFNITFKSLTPFDLKNEVFGRVIRPSATFDNISTVGDPLGTQPVVEIAATKRKHNGRWIRGVQNTRLVKF